MLPRILPPPFLVGDEGMRAPYIPFKEFYRALTASFPTKNQPVKPSKEKTHPGHPVHRCRHAILGGSWFVLSTPIQGTGFRVWGLGFRV